MADQQHGPPGQPGPVALRLTLAFVAVALAAVALVAGLTAAFAAADVADLASRQRANLTAAITVAAGPAWDRRRSWTGAGLAPVLDLAERTGAVVQIRDAAGRSRPGGGEPGRRCPGSPPPAWAAPARRCEPRC